MKRIEIWEKTINIPISLVDFKGNLRIDSIFSIMQNEALEHSESIGVGFNKFLKEGQIWVLTWAKIEVLICPKFEENVIIKTWLKEQNKLFTMRDFLFLKENNNTPLIKASTGWLLLNAKTKRPTRPKSLPNTVVFLPEVKALDEKPKKLEKISEPRFLKSFTIEYTDIDMNNHVNNTKYIEFILNSFPIEKFKSQIIKTLRLFFFSEAKYGEKLEVLINEDANTSQLLIRNKTKNSEILRADIVWGKP